MKKSIHEFRRFLFATIMLLGVGVTAWGTNYTLALTDASKSGDVYTWTSNLPSTLKNNVLYVEVPSNMATATVGFVCGSAKTDRFVYCYPNGVKADDRKVDMAKSYQTIAVSSADIVNEKYIQFSTTDDYKPTGIQLTVLTTSGGDDCTPLAVNFAAGEGTGSMDADECCPEKTYTIPACTFTAPDGKEFDAWTSSDVTITDGKFTMPSSAVTLTATWKDAVTVVPATGVSIEVSATKVKVGETIPLPLLYCRLMQQISR